MAIESMNASAECFRLLALTRQTSRNIHGRDSLSESEAHAQLLGSFFSAATSTLQEAVEISRKLFKADAAGLHLCGRDASGVVTCTDVIAGAFSMHEGVQPSVGCGLCKRALHAGAPIVLSEQEIELTYLRHVEPRVVHLLMAPIYDGVGEALGVIWLAQVTSATTYSRIDALALERLTHVLAASIAAWHRTRELESLRATLESERATHQNALAELTSSFEQQLGHDDLAVREAHHRVKNTLQIVSSLLRLQAKCTSETEAATALREATARLEVLMHAHEHLYRAGIASQEISVANLLRVIASALRTSVAETSSRVQLELTATDIYLPPTEASAIALIANEVLTNAYKHAFPNNTAGSITVELQRDSKCAAILRITDTGTGADIQAASDTFGMWLVRKLAQQLGATLQFSSCKDPPGTCFVLEVPFHADLSGGSSEGNAAKHLSFSVPNRSVGVVADVSGADDND